mmetsp:Transcript_17016/g.24705  ORF Transcript_17016/g.24705 Transcript_17016/m.24705 type:complete len:88 (-) Transcript_17016:1174-1437(-)
MRYNEVLLISLFLSQKERGSTKEKEKIKVLHFNLNLVHSFSKYLSTLLHCTTQKHDIQKHHSIFLSFTIPTPHFTSLATKPSQSYHN